MDKYLGKRLDGRYEIQNIIGVGGMACVYKAFDNVEQKYVAVKILKEEFTSNEDFLRRFKNESKAIAMLSHPNIVKVYDVSFGDLIQYIVMEYIDGVTLKEYIKSNGKLSWMEAVNFELQILRALQHAHDKGIIHRDVKPQNIMVLADGCIKVTDFGIARFSRNEQRTITDKAIGSVHYISPEQARGEKTDEKADIYSAGIVLYEMLTGQLPFQGDSPISVALMHLSDEAKSICDVDNEMPKGLDEIVSHSMEKEINKRYQSASEMLCDLDNFKRDPDITFNYTYFEDDEPTKYVGDAISSSSPASMLPTQDLEEDNQSDKKSSLLPVLLGVSIALAVLLVIGGIFLIKWTKSSTGTGDDCPNFYNISLEEIKEKYDDVYKFTIIDEYNDDVEQGYVYDQKPEKGKQIKKGAEITLYVSKGSEGVIIPDVYGEPELTAKKQIEQYDLITEVVIEASDDVDEGKVIRTEPIRTTTVKKGSTVTLYVSAGKTVENVDVPNIVGNKSTAVQTSLGNSFIAKIVEEDMTADDTYYPAGYVFKQSPEAGNSVAQGSTVTAYISTGKTKYNFDLIVNKIPENYDKNSLVASLYIDGVEKAISPKIDTTVATSITFKDLSFIVEDKPNINNTLLEAYVKDEDGNRLLEFQIDITTGTIYHNFIEDVYEPANEEPEEDYNEQ